MVNTNQKHTYKKQLKILFWNTRSLKQRLPEIQSSSHLFDIIICVETWLKENDIVRLPGFTTYRKDRTHSTGGGIILFIKNNLAFKEIKNIKTTKPTIELCGINFNNVNPPLNIYTCYRTPRAYSFPGSLGCASSKCKQRKLFITWRF